MATSNASSPILSSSPENESQQADSLSSPMVLKFDDISANSIPKKKEYPIDMSFPDIKNSIYSIGKFRISRTVYIQSTPILDSETSELQIRTTSPTEVNEEEK
ncbi:hypothetical protein FXO38_10530 [Capsicum annuum]|uniref:Uncharacterized protein n=1 Tax=Capsicum annuum TaxID=4072 RepID=A0A2G2YXB4_CAPAN|nr:hypothetical protein FXO38_10530 [Capsicum annuum]KAF3666618.1 hypothetical protein FXO37_10440 [Capsicum annuum]PHT74384.1 hypothetical protein T459_21661 [Capsicum annuum]